MKARLFYPTAEGEARLLLLIASFSSRKRCLEGRTKLAKLDFFLRYPAFLERALRIRAPGSDSHGASPGVQSEGTTIEAQMVRFRFGPWDPAYYSLLGSLIGRGLVDPVHEARGMGFKATALGSEVAANLSMSPEWAPMQHRIRLLAKHFDVNGETLKKFIYKHFPEVVSAHWGQVIESPRLRAGQAKERAT